MERAASRPHGAKSPVLALMGLMVLCLVTLPASGTAAGLQDRVETLLLESFRLQNQPASESLLLIEPLLSERGTVSVDREKNTVVVRDRASVVTRLRPLLAEFDHERRILRVDIYLLRASRTAKQASPAKPGSSRFPAGQRLPKDIAVSLDNLLAFKHYETLGSEKLLVREGERVDRTIGESHRLSFRMGTVLLEQRLRMHSVELKRESGSGREKRMFHADVNLKKGKVLLLTVSADRQSQSGVVIAMSWRPTNQVSPPVRE